MGGAKRYSDEQIWFIVSRVRSNLLKQDEIIQQFNERWPHRTEDEKLGRRQLKYLKSSYGNDPGFAGQSPHDHDWNHKEEDKHKVGNSDQLAARDASTAGKSCQESSSLVGETVQFGSNPKMAPVMMANEVGGRTSDPTVSNYGIQTGITQTSLAQPSIYHADTTNTDQASLSPECSTNLMAAGQAQMPILVPKRTLEGLCKNTANFSNPGSASWNQGLGQYPSEDWITGIGQTDSAGTWYTGLHGRCPISVLHRHHSNGGIYFNRMIDLIILLKRVKGLNNTRANGSTETEAFVEDPALPLPKRQNGGRLAELTFARLNRESSQIPTAVQVLAVPSQSSMATSPPMNRSQSAQTLSGASGNSLRSAAARRAIHSAGQSPSMNFSALSAGRRDGQPRSVLDSGVTTPAVSTMPNPSAIPGGYGGGQGPNPMTYGMEPASSSESLDDFSAMNCSTPPDSGYKYGSGPSASLSTDGFPVPNQVAEFDFSHEKANINASSSSSVNTGQISTSPNTPAASFDASQLEKSFDFSDFDFDAASVDFSNIFQ